MPTLEQLKRAQQRALDRGADDSANRIGQRISLRQPMAESTPAPQFDPGPLNLPTTPFNKDSNSFTTTTSTKERAQGLIDKDISEQRSKEQELLGEIITPGSLEEQLEQQKQRNQQELETFNRVQERNERIRTQQLEEARDNTERAGASVTAQFSRGREGVMSSGSSAVIQEFKSTINKRFQNQKLQYENALDQVESARRNLEFAQQSGLADTIKTARSTLAQAEQQVIREETALQQVQAENTKLALDIQKEEAQVRRDAFNFFNSAPEGMFASADVGQLVETFGFDTGTASLLKGLDQERQKIKQSDPDYLLKKAELLEKQNQALLGGMTEEQKLILQYGKPVEVGNSTFEFDFEKKKWVPSVGGLPSGSNGFSPPAGTKYQWNPTRMGGVKIAVNEGDLAGQCGRFVNDVLGEKVFGDLYEDKKLQKNSDIPVPGAAFIMNTNDKYGHVGFVEEVLFNGDLAIVDSNFKRDERIRKDVIKKGSPEYNAIVGYYIPPTAITEKEVVLSQIRNGNITNTEVSKIREQAKQEGWLPELNGELNNPKNKLIGEKMATQFMTDATMTNRQFDDLIQKREELGFGNKNFQGVGQKDIEGFNQFIELGTRLQQAKDTWEQLKAEHGGLSGVWDAGIKRTLARGTTALGFAPTKEFRLYQQLEALTGESLASYVASISGAAVSEQEFQRLKQNKPNVSMNDQQFEDQLNRMIQEYDNSVRSKVGRYGFTDDIQLKNAITRYGQMPTNLGEISNGGSQDDEFLASLGFDTTTDDIYTNIFSSPR